MAYNINGNIPCGTDACTGRQHSPAGACNSVYDIILDAIKDVKGEVNDKIAKESTLVESTDTITSKIASVSSQVSSSEQTLIQGVGDIINALDNVEVDLTPIAKEQTLTQGVADIIKAVENIDFTDLENSIAEVKNAVVNIDFSTLAKEQTLLDKAEEIKQAVEKGGGGMTIQSQEEYADFKSHMQTRINDILNN